MIINNPFSLEGKTILVTGASSGIGKGIALGCSRMGAQLVLNGRNKERLEQTLNELEGNNHLIIQADLSQQTGLDELVSNCPQLNGVVHSAGIPKICAIKHLTRSILEEIVNVNEIAPILLTSSLIKNKRIQKKSSIVFIASTAGIFTSGAIGDSDYSATKGGISGFVMTAARELGIKGIRVNTICPAIVETPLLEHSLRILTKDELEEKLRRYHIKRFGKPEDIANGAIYLLSDASSWVTGINLAIDGGCHL